MELHKYFVDVALEECLEPIAIALAAPILRLGTPIPVEGLTGTYIRIYSSISFDALLDGITEMWSAVDNGTDPPTISEAPMDTEEKTKIQGLIDQEEPPVQAMAAMHA